MTTKTLYPDTATHTTHRPHLTPGSCAIFALLAACAADPVTDHADTTTSYGDPAPSTSDTGGSETGTPPPDMPEGDGAPDWPAPPAPGTLWGPCVDGVCDLGVACASGPGWSVCVGSAVHPIEGDPLDPNGDHCWPWDPWPSNPAAHLVKHASPYCVATCDPGTGCAGGPGLVCVSAYAADFCAWSDHCPG